MTETIHRVLDRIETQTPHHRLIDTENVEIGSNEMSIDLLRAVYRNNSLPLYTRMRAAMACLKHEVPALLATAIVEEGSFAELLDRRLAKLQEMRLLEARTITIEKPKPKNRGRT